MQKAHLIKWRRHLYWGEVLQEKRRAGPIDPAVWCQVDTSAKLGRSGKHLATTGLVFLDEETPIHSNIGGADSEQEP